MRRLLLTLAVFAAVVAAVAAVRVATAEALASCDFIASHAPILNANIQGHWYVEQCSAKTTVKATLQEHDANEAWQIATCSGGNLCVHTRPAPSDNSACDPFYCAYGNRDREENFDQTDGVCSHTWRVRVTVFNPTGDLIGSANSPTRGPC